MKFRQRKGASPSPPVIRVVKQLPGLWVHVDSPADFCNDLAPHVTGIVIRFKDQLNTKDRSKIITDSLLQVWGERDSILDQERPWTGIYRITLQQIYTYLVTVKERKDARQLIRNFLTSMGKKTQSRKETYFIH
jgi:hypothetical protein